MDSQKYLDKVIEIQKGYLESVLPLVATYEVVSRKYPLVVLVELRNICTHLARSWMRFTEGNEKKCFEELDKAEKHCDRVVLDCFKCCCVAIDDYVKEVKETTFKFVDSWSLIDTLSGDIRRNLLGEILSLEMEAKKTLS